MGPRGQDGAPSPFSQGPISRRPRAAGALRRGRRRVRESRRLPKALLGACLPAEGQCQGPRPASRPRVNSGSRIDAHSAAQGPFVRRGSRPRTMPSGLWPQHSQRPSRPSPGRVLGSGPEAPAGAGAPGSSQGGWSGQVGRDGRRGCPPRPLQSSLTLALRPRGQLSGPWGCRPHGPSPTPTLTPGALPHPLPSQWSLVHFPVCEASLSL